MFPLYFSSSWRGRTSHRERWWRNIRPAAAAGWLPDLQSRGKIDSDATNDLGCFTILKIYLQALSFDMNVSREFSLPPWQFSRSERIVNYTEAKIKECLLHNINQQYIVLLFILYRLEHFDQMGYHSIKTYILLKQREKREKKKRPTPGVTRDPEVSAWLSLYIPFFFVSTLQNVFFLPREFR